MNKESLVAVLKTSEGEIRKIRMEIERIPEADINEEILDEAVEKLMDAQGQIEPYFDEVIKPYMDVNECSCEDYDDDDDTQQY